MRRLPLGISTQENYKFAGTPVNFLICALCVRDLQNPHSIFSLFHTHTTFLILLYIICEWGGAPKKLIIFKSDSARFIIHKNCRSWISNLPSMEQKKRFNAPSGPIKNMYTSWILKATTWLSTNSRSAHKALRREGFERARWLCCCCLE